MKLIDRCTSCKYLIDINEDVTNYCINQQFSAHMATFADKDRSSDDTLIKIIMPQEFGCLFWEEKAKDETI